jgi:hypothetical protein
MVRIIKVYNFFCMFFLNLKAVKGLKWLNMSKWIRIEFSAFLFITIFATF